MSDFLAEIMAGARCAIEPLDNAFTNEQTLRDFFAEFGWDVEATPAQVSTIRTGFALAALFDVALDVATQLESGGDVATLAPELKDAVVKILAAVKALSASPPAGLPAPLDQPAFWNEFPPALGDFLVLKHVETNRGAIYGALVLSGLAEVTQETPAGPGRLPYRKRTIRWDRMPRVVGDPAALIKEIYSWDGAQPFDYARLFEGLRDVVRAYRFPARLDGVSQTFAERYYDPGNPALPGLRELTIPLLSVASADRSSEAELGLALVPIPPDGAPTQAPVGFALAPVASGDMSSGVASPAVSGTSLTFKGSFHEEGALVAEIRPSGVQLVVAPGATSIEAGLTFAAKPDAPWILLGDAGSSRVEVGGFEAGLEVKGQITSPEVIASLGTGSGANPPKIALVIQMTEGDGFLAKVLGTSPIKVDMGGMVLWSSKTGLHLEGGGGFEFAIPLHVSIGIAEAERLLIAVHGSDGLAVDVGVDGKVLLGPLTGVVQNVGFRTTLKFAGSDGHLGDIAIGFAFKPPTGVGLAIDAGPVKGGGFISFDPDHGEYAGVLELTFSGFLSLKAIGLITTKMPDGSPGFSLLIIITAEFGTGIQLGFGFTLIGVGGLIGLNRTMQMQPLMEGVRTGAINGIMFPQDPVANAPRIISDLRTIFPPQEGIFLIGPMAKLGWGTPTLVSLSLGIVIEIPPGNIAILGVLRIALPTDDAAIIVLQVNFAGAIEFDKKRLYFFASLFDSRILFLTIEGEMGVLAAFGDDANFVLSVGGFHPSFNPPPLPFPSPRRIEVDILNTDNARLRVQGYFAVTTNTAQFGASVDAFFGVSDFNVQGNLGFDALFQFSPFHFVITISAGFSVEVFGVGMFGIHAQFTLEGPTPWRAHGTGSISLLFFDIDVGFDVTWGDSQDTTLPAIPVLPLVKAELGKNENWRALLPAGSNLLVSLRTLDPTVDDLVLHPVGVLRVSQRGVPLDEAIDKVGNQKPSDANRFTVTPAVGALAKSDDALESFAPGQFHDYDDATKLSKPAYAPGHGGVELSAQAGQLRSSTAIKRVVRYELITIDTNYRRFVKRFHVFAAGLFAHFLLGASVARSPLSAQSKKQFQPFDEKIVAKPDGFTVASVVTNEAIAAEAVSFPSEALAQQYLSDRVAGDPSLDGSLHVIPAFERAA